MPELAMNGGTPVRATSYPSWPVWDDRDVEPRTWTIDPDQVEGAITDRTRAIMPVHLGHQMADMDRLEKIARRHGLAVVEDCAHAPGQQWRGRGAGCIGEFGSVSPQSSKILPSREGGTLPTQDD